LFCQAALPPPSPPGALKQALASCFRRLCSRMDKSKAVTAAAHKLARLTYTIRTKDQEYTDQGQDYYEARHRERVLRALSLRAAKMGMQIVPVAQPS
jgi:transposase